MAQLFRQLAQRRPLPQREVTDLIFALDTDAERHGQAQYRLGAHPLAEGQLKAGAPYGPHQAAQRVQVGDETGTPGLGKAHLVVKVHGLTILIDSQFTTS